MWWPFLLRRHQGTVPAGRHARGAAVPVPVLPRAVLPLVPAEAPAAPVLARNVVVPSSTDAVGLVFADGASVELDPDDPRVRTFRAAAAALVDPTAR